MNANSLESIEDKFDTVVDVRCRDNVLRRVGFQMENLVVTIKDIVMLGSGEEELDRNESRLGT